MKIVHITERSLHLITSEWVPESQSFPLQVCVYTALRQLGTVG